MNNIPQIIEAALLLLITFLIGCVIGWILRAKIFKVRPPGVAPADEKVVATNERTIVADKKVAEPATQPKTASVTPLKSVPEAPKTLTPAKTTNKAPKAEKPAPEAEEKSPTQKPATLSAPRDGKKDDLKKIKGVGPKLETTLNELGIYHFDQIAQWSQKEIDWVDDYLSFKGRIERDEWIAQAKKLKS